MARMCGKTHELSRDVIFASSRTLAFSDVFIIGFFFQFIWKGRRGQFLLEIVEFSGIVPYGEDLEPLATPEEAAEHEARMTDEAKIERLYQARFTQKVELAAWYDI